MHRAACLRAIVAFLERQLGEKRYAAGDRFTAADVQLGTGIGYTMNIMNALPERPVFKEYVARIEQRPAYRKAQQIDMELASRIPFFSGENAPGNV